MKNTFSPFRLVGLALSIMMAFASCTATETSIPTNTNSPVATVRPSETITVVPSSSPTFTPLPTLSPEDAQVFVLELIATNGNCHLPCWWGITPGETTWEEANAFLATFASSILELQPNLYGVVYENLPKELSYSWVGATLHVENGVVQTIRTGAYFSISEIFEIYGQPTEIWIFADSQSINRQAPFTIALFYMDKGILGIYNGSTNKGETLEICPSTIGGDQQAWLLWNPELNLTFEQAGANGLLFDTHPSDRPLFQLEEVTNTDVATFYETYKDPENANVCFDMSVQ